MECSFCGDEIEKGTEKICVTKKGKASYFCSSKCEKNLLKLGRKPRKTRWTKAYMADKAIRLRSIAHKEEKGGKAEKRQGKTETKETKKTKTQAETKPTAKETKPTAKETKPTAKITAKKETKKAKTKTKPKSKKITKSKSKKK